MSTNGSVTATFSARSSILSSSQLLSSSMTSNSSRHSSSQISKIYRQASTLFLTRRLPESLSTILPVITAPTSDVDLNGSSEPAPIASASRTTRIKVWSLYLTILNAVVELDPDEGKQAFGSQEWRALVSKVRDGAIWEEVVTNGYGGVEGDVDSDVVINLATLLLAHARSQTENQQRLENYLAASNRPNLDISARLQQSERLRSGTMSPTRSIKSGTDTPRDLNARVKILELYTLHVLLRNNEWDYAREFIGVSEVLDEERREAFLQALQSLQDEQTEADNRERETQQRQEEQLQRDLQEARRRRIEAEERERARYEEARSSSKRASSEIDYGIETGHPNGSANGSATGRPKGGMKRSSVNVSRGSVSGKAVTPKSVVARALMIVGNIKRVLENMALAFGSNPMILLRTLAFIVALVLALSRKGVKEKIKKVLGNGWSKVKATAGMGVKVSYI